MTPTETLAKVLMACVLGLQADTIGKKHHYLDSIHSLLTALEQTGEWQDISTAPRDGAVFVCRRKTRPHITFEASIMLESDGWEYSHKSYHVLVNETNEDDILDDAWEAYEWMHLPAPPMEGDKG